MRYLPLTATDRQAMLDKIGVRHIDELFKDIPNDVLNPEIDLPRHKSEMEVERYLSRMAAQNTAAGSVPFFVGAGAYKHHVPATVDHMIQRGEFLTAYTPYQPEIAQGTLQYIFEFQTQVAQLTGMDVANASMYDGSTGCSEAVMMARRVTRKKKAILAGSLHAHYASVVETTTQFTDDVIERLAPNPANPEAELQAAIDAIDADTSCVVFQNPGVFGSVLDLRPLAEKAHENKALLIVVLTEVMSLGLIESPGEMGADIVVGEGQSIGNGLNFGGPYLGLFATNQKFVRQMPGRLCGETVDADGKRGFVLTLSTREQHIRREKATSNICTNSGLCALAFTVHMTLLGEKGLRGVSLANHKAAVDLRDALKGVDGVEVLNTTFFNEFSVKLSKDAAGVVDALADKGILAGVPASRLYPGAGLDDVLILAATETVSADDIDALVAGLKEVL
ncbi:aminomethyl-transferring glycine dehydrogenase subunit GcvPA [Kordiimonas lacus]|uniref:Probable glycine dehydrogenase (decarboxylating) subunit 1 n=1 Tax=Kordiimonas lacus TaxID=637679 RepID=A0A1G7B3F5_9PROT|nr:aminomethyl-transferring glycine dehydrogenase subunit GcvPA [Kordiimonas lacus]SDE21482.1 glycine dehydrogenase subunit 1 [Kordiimonas lacus]